MNREASVRQESAQSDRITSLIGRLAIIVWLVAVAGFWFVFIAAIIPTRGVFDWLGYDYAPFWAAGRAVLAQGPAAAYDLRTLEQQIQPLAAYLGPKNTGLALAPGLYPPIFFVFLAPFALLPGGPSFLLWTVIQAVLAVYVIYGLATRFPAHRLLITICSFFFLPLSYVFFFGQSTVIPMLALYLALRDFERGRDFRAGVWLGLIFIKPQYALLLPFVLIYKRRWHALAGVVAVLVPLGITSLALLGPSGLAAYQELSQSYSGFQNTYLSVFPKDMISWRGILINLFPTLSEEAGQAFTLAMSALTAALLIPIWHGRWDPKSARFSVQLLGTILVILITSYHSHIHGAVLMIVPAMAFMASGGGSKVLRGLILAALFVMPVWFAVIFFVSPSYVTTWQLMTRLFIAMMALALACCVWEGVRPFQGRAVTPTPDNPTPVPAIGD